MNNQRPADRVKIADIVLTTLRDALSIGDNQHIEPLDESTPLLGRRSDLDSVGLVRLIVDLEQRLEQEYYVSVTLADERAMSQRVSPFRDVRSLTDYICMLIEED